MSGSPEPAIDCIGRLVPATLRALHALEFAGRHLAPDTIVMPGKSSSLDCTPSLYEAGVKVSCRS